MAKKIYDFLPGHLKNRELESIFETTLNRAFSVGEMEKTKAFVGRKEKGIFKSDDIYLSFPPTSYARDNYGLEPTFTNTTTTDNVYYDDLLNALYNKGALTNDHRRLFNSKSTLSTVALPIDLDKFINYSMYYWVSPNFHAHITGSVNKHYVTINRTTTPTNWWSKNNYWYHYDDIKDFIFDSNSDEIAQATRPIIEFDEDLELSNESAAVSLTQTVSAIAGAFVVGSTYTIASVGTTDFTSIGASDNEIGTTFTATDVGSGTGSASWQYIPSFKAYNSSNVYANDIKIFHYVVSENYTLDKQLGFKPKLKAGDFQSEYVFNIDLTNDLTYKLKNDYKSLTLKTDFDYRNLRQEIGDKVDATSIELLQAPKSINAIDLYIDGQKQIGNYSYSSSDKKITLTSPITGNIYVDYCTNTPVVFDGDGVFQRINPALEYNVDNKSYSNSEMTFSLVYEHFVRIIETAPGLTGSPDAGNNYRKIGNNSDKLRHASQGSVLVTNSVDIKEAYFALTREDYNPIKATEFLSNSYNGYKNKFLTTIIETLSDSASDTKSDLLILEEAINTISTGKQTSVSIFRDSTMLNFGEIHAHYEELDVTVIDGATEQVMPTFRDSILYDKNIVVILDGVVQRLNVDYTLSSGATEILFTSTRTSSDTIKVRHYTNIKETYIPPSATSLAITPAHIPEIITDNGYETPTKFIKGHDGSLVPAYPLVNGQVNRIDTILLAFETLIFNNLADNTSSDITSMNYAIYGTTGSDYSNSEKKYIMYPFFKKWMMRNSIDDLNNESFDASPSEYKTWNYRAKNDSAAGYWRGQLLYSYGTDRPLQEPWKAIKKSQKPTNFDTTYGSDYTTIAFWNKLISTNSLNCPVPVDVSGNLKTPAVLFFGNDISSSDILEMDQAWEFGDNSPVELAWTRSSEFAFAEFMLMLLSKPFEIMDSYSSQIANIISFSNKSEGINNDDVIADKQNYTFKLGSKLGGFVNNFKLQTENNSLSNSRYTELPTDNFNLFVHSGVPNRSEFFSAIVLEKVSIEDKYPVYAYADLASYVEGDIVLNSNDNKYYKRKVTGLSSKESTTPAGSFIIGTTYKINHVGSTDFTLVGSTNNNLGTSFVATGLGSGNGNVSLINFDYSQWTLISQPKINKFGFRIHGYDEINPTFYAMGWDKASGEKAFQTEGDKLQLKTWNAGEYYRLDSYILRNNVPYVCLNSHTAPSDFDESIKNWKPVSKWPTTNKVQAMGYNKLVDDTVKNYNYGDVLQTLDDVAHLIMGYEEYLKLVGWEFTDSTDFGEPVDWENLLLKFLEWQSENNSVGDFITLTPLLTGGIFNTDYGVASVSTETFKNYYRILDASGRRIPTSEVDFHTDGSKLTFASNVPIYGMKMDIRDIEHAFVVDRVDSYGDIIYDPHSHTRNLRMQIDCNRTVDWDGTLTVDGYIVHNDKLIPNFDTMIAETKFYRDTLVDQGLSILNNLKSNQYGYTTRAYLTNHGIERESQLEFYKGFLSHKATVSSINKIVNKNGDFENITHSDIWAVRLSDYGYQSSKYTMSKQITVTDMVQNPFLVQYQDNTKELLPVTKKNNIAIKTTGYVNESDVTYITGTYDSLTSLTGVTLYEGDTAWLQTDEDRDWDVVRLSEVAEISYVGETSDNQLYIGTASAINSTSINKPIYLKIDADEISPTIAGYYLLSANGTKTVNSVVIHEYLIFEEDFEPLTIEIDSATTNSIFVPTSTNSGVEAIGSISNPVFESGDIITIDGTQHTYAPSGATSSGITILGTVANSVVTEGEQASFVVYNDDGLVENGTNTTVTFSGTVATTTGAFSSTQGDQVTIDGTTLTIDYSQSSTISETTTATRSSSLTTGNTVIIDATTKTVEDLTVQGTVTSPTMTSTKPLTINGDTISLTSGDDLTAIVTAINTGTSQVVASTSSNQLVLTTSLPQLTMTGGSLIDLGLSTTNSYTDSKLDNLATDLTAISDITATIDSNNRMTIVSSGSSMVISGTALGELGITAGTYETNQNPTIDSVVTQINARSISGVTASVLTGTLKISSTNHNLDIVEVTSGAMSRLGFVTTTVAIDATDTIVSDLNAQVFTISTAFAVKSDRQVKITSSEKTIIVSNILGNPLSDMGITAGTYTNTVSTSPTALEFASQITSASDVVVGVSSDGRMIFTNDSVSMSFSGTPDAILTKVGLSLTYSNVTSNANFKAMLWKSVRYTPDYNGTTRLEFEQELGLNSASKLWIDDYDTVGWAVLSYNPISGKTVHAKQASVIDTNLTKRLIVQNGEDFIIHNIYDPLNLKMAGSNISKLDYVMWTDPAKYDTTSSNDAWLDEKLNKMWWDTDLARFYRYNDYGDSAGNLNIDFVRRYWGKTVDNSKLIVKKWTKSRTLPVGVEAYNSKKFFDEDAGREVIEYFFWSTTDKDAKDLSLLLASNGPRNKFLPVGKRSVIMSNDSKSYNSETLTASLEYQVEDGIVKEHSDWQLLPENDHTPVPDLFLDDLINSVSGTTIKQSYATKLTAPQLTDVNFAVVTPVDSMGIQFMSGLTIDDIAVTTDGKTVNAQYLTIDGSNLKISQTHTMTVGDVLRVYRVEETENNWFTNKYAMRDNFSTVVNDAMSRKLLQTEYYNYKQYIDTDDYIFSLGDWYIDDSFKKIDNFAYLSTTREFDMLERYENGISSFKLKLPTHNEFYFEYNDELRLVNRSNSVLNISLGFNDFTYPETVSAGQFVIGNTYEILEVGTTDFVSLGASSNSSGGKFVATGVGSGTGTAFSQYYNNATGIQIHELMNLIRNRSKTEFINNIFYRMIDYLYTEKSYPDWLFKTSYFDLDLHSRPLKQHAVYQRESEEDILEYIRETKPYHAKIRNIKRLNQLSDTASVTMSAEEKLKMTLDFGEASRYGEAVYDGIATEDIADGEYEQGGLIRYRPFATTETGGFDTGEVNARAVESSVVVVQNYLDAPGGADADVSGVQNLGNLHLDKTEFFVYDVYGRGYNIPVKASCAMAEDVVITAGSFVVGRTYTIVTSGTTDFVSEQGASANTVGTEFVATAVGSGTGTASGPFMITSSGLTNAQLIASKKNKRLIAVMKASSHTHIAGKFKIGEQYVIDTIGTTDFTLVGGVSNTVGGIFTASGVGEGTGTATCKEGNDIEFMMYDKHTSGTLNIDDRGLYTTMTYDFKQGDRVFILDTPLALVLQDPK